VPSNITTTTHYYSRGNIELAFGMHRDEVITFAGAAVLIPGTIMARITATGRLTPFVVGGALGAGTPVGVLTYEVSATGAGDVSCRVLVKGEVNRNRLIVHADQNGNALTPAHLDMLRNVGITPVDVQTLATQV
jgi:hypothetical protein